MKAIPITRESKVFTHYSIRRHINSNNNMNNIRYQTLVTTAPLYQRCPPGKCYAVVLPILPSLVPINFPLIHHFSGFQPGRRVSSLPLRLHLCAAPSPHSSNRNTQHDLLSCALPHTFSPSIDFHMKCTEILHSTPYH